MDAQHTEKPAAAAEIGGGSSDAPVVVDSEDFPLGKACDLTGDGTCEACQ